MKKLNLMVLLSLTCCMTGFGQNSRLSLKDCIQIALKRNLQVRDDSFRIEQARILRRTSFNPDKTDFTLDQDPTEGGNSDNAVTVSQRIAWPGVYVHQSRVNRRQQSVLEKEKSVNNLEIVRLVALNFYDYAYTAEKLKLYQSLDSIYQDFADKSAIRVKTGEANRLEVLAAKNKFQETRILLQQTESERDQILKTIQELLRLKEPPELTLPDYHPLNDLSFSDSSEWDQNPQLAYGIENIQLADEKIKLERSGFWPDFVFGYSRQVVIKRFDPAHINRDYFPGTRTGGFQVGLSLPVFSGRAVAARVKAEQLGKSIAENRLALIQNQLKSDWSKAVLNYKKYKTSLDYYQNSGLTLAGEQMNIAQISFAKGDIGYVEFIQNVSQAIEIRLNYLALVNQFNAGVIQLQFLTGKLNSF